MDNIFFKVNFNQPKNVLIKYYQTRDNIFFLYTKLMYFNYKKFFK